MFKAKIGFRSQKSSICLGRNLAKIWWTFLQILLLKIAKKPTMSSKWVMITQLRNAFSRMSVNFQAILG
jgi:hypothetical protein